MGRNKKRLHVALYPSGVTGNEERKFHWAFIIGPKGEDKKKNPGLRCHVKNLPPNHWVYEENELEDVQCTFNLLARLVIAKIEDEKRLLEIFRETAIVQDDPNFRCRTWMADVLSRISRAEPRVVGTSDLDWGRIEQRARGYVGKKIAEGRYLESGRALKPKPTWDMMEKKETIP
ncbi:hypothetical protein E4U41_005572 [Claviceps citrina]|nr:hypothetical protein E4U41_005572 [Claviceps citrina]